MAEPFTPTNEDQFGLDLSERMRGCAAHSRLNNVLAWLVILTAVISSAAATVLVAAGSSSTTLTAVLAALPGLATVIASKMKFEERAEWWNMKWRPERGPLSAPL